MTIEKKKKEEEENVVGGRSVMLCHLNNIEIMMCWLLQFIINIYSTSC